ncbi:MAG: hypothetical protein ACERKJ_11875 [Candidatus Dadabacteria bacterium]
MANNFMAANKLTGGTAGCLDDIDHANLADGDVGFVVDAINNKAYFYTYESSNSDAESSPDTIVPDSNSGNGRWVLTVLQSAGALMRSVFATTTYALYMAALSIEYDHIFIPAGAFYPSSSLPCADVFVKEYDDTGTVDLQYLAFDGGAADEYAFINFKMPPSWDLSTIKVKFHWAPGHSDCTAADVVTWGVDGVVLGNDDNIDGTAHGTSVTVDDAVTAGKDGDMHVTAASGAVTIAGTPALDDIINLRVYRDADASEGSDDMAEDAWLFGITIQYKRTSTTTAW